jgi:hypothetical protein
LVEISVKHTLGDLSKHLTRLQKKELPKVIVGALNKTTDNVRVVVQKDVSAATGVAQKRVKPHLVVRKAHPGRLTATISSSKRTFNLARFATPAAIRNYRKSKGLKAKAFGSRARVFPGVFIGNKGRTAFVRDGGKVRAAHGPSIPRAMVSPRVNKKVREKIAEQFPKNFRSQLKRKFERKR